MSNGAHFVSRENPMTTTTIHYSIANLVAEHRQRLGFAKGREISIANTRAALAPATAAVRRELDLDLIDDKPTRGRATRIARKLRFNREVKAYRDSVKAHRESIGLPFTERGITQWTSRILARLK
jgi:hypothetical protein